MSKAVVVFSGGQDSTTCLLQALDQYQEVHAITFDYGQRHSSEIEVAKTLCQTLGVINHKVMDVSLLNELAISSLTRADIEVSNEVLESGVPNSFVPGRNILFLTLAGVYAYQIGANAIITGVCETDFSGYPDCRNEFVQSMEKSLGLGMDKDIEIQTPLMWLTKAETWAMANELGKLSLVRDKTLTCYNDIIGSGCGECPACLLRQQGLDEFLENPKQITQSYKGKINR